MDIHFYADSRGRQPVYDWLKTIQQREPETFRKTIQLLSYLEENGHRIAKKEIKRDDIKQLKGTDGIWQLRINQNRLLYFYYAGNTIVLTSQFKKKQKKTPRNEIKRAERRKKKWVQRKQ